MHKFYNSRVFQFFAIIIISSLCLLLDNLTRINYNKIELPKNRPEYNAKNVDGRVYNKSGKLLYTLISDEAYEYPSDERIFLKNLKIDMFHESSDAIKYQISSDNGWINHTTKQGELGVNTVVTVTDPDPSKVIQMYGSDISLDLAKNIFTSSANTHATQGKSTLYTNGFSYDNNQKLLILNSKVRIIYDK